MEPEAVVLKMRFPIKSGILLILALLFILGCADPYGDISGNFYAPRVRKELSCFVATYSVYPTNHFFVGAISLDQTNLDEALVYWQEDQIILLYDELVPSAEYGVEAWRNREWKLCRDTVKTPDEINGSDYLITDDNWHDWTNQCISCGRQYIILKDNARHEFPNEETITNNTGL